MPLFPRMRQLLFDESPAVRQAAAVAMYSLASVSGTKLADDLHVDLLKALDDSNPDVRRQAAGILARLKDKIAETQAALKNAAREDEELNVRMQAAAALGQCVKELAGDDPLRREVVDLLSVLVEKDESFYVRELAVHYLKELAPKDERALRGIVRATADEWHGVRDKANQALQDLGHGDLLVK
jgi:HEAT repeat protein